MYLSLRHGATSLSLETCNKFRQATLKSARLLKALGEYMHRAILLLLFSVSAAADGLLVNFEEGHFLQAYRHQTYIKSGLYIHIDDHYKYDEKTDDVIPHVPEIYSIQLTESQEANLVAELISLGVANWKPKYPENEPGLICDGLGFSLYIKHENLNINTQGGCRFPPKYKEVVELFASIYQSPNKSKQQGPSAGTR